MLRGPSASITPEGAARVWGEPDLPRTPGTLAENIKVGVTGLKGFPCYVNKTYKSVEMVCMCRGEEA